jgi:metallo-beta-lactamase class B
VKNIEEMSEQEIQQLEAEMERKVQPLKIFDDVYFVGKVGVGCFIVDTGEGYVLIDAMDPADAAENNIIPGMETLGLDPGDIKAILITHGHFDHFCGARHLQQTYRCKVGMGQIDMAYMLRSEDGPSEEFVFPHIDFLLEDGKALKIGRTEFLPILTPGHTPGCMSLIFNCHDKGKEHWVSLWGGTGLPRPDMEHVKRVQATCDYIGSSMRFLSFCSQYGCDVVLAVHPHRCGLFEKAEALPLSEINPFLVGTAGVESNLHQNADEAIKQLGELLAAHG